MGETVSFGTRVVRGLTRRCARCGHGAFESWFRMAETCPRCGIKFMREEGYWVGAMIMNTTATFLAFGLAFIGLIVATWPDVEWGTVMAASIGICAIVPIVFYPISKSLWFALELTWHPLEEHELTEARTRVGV